MRAFLVLCVVIIMIFSDAMAASCIPEERINFNALPRCTMRGFGEPHIETCDDPGTSTTCYAPGCQNYLDIYFLRVDVVHTIVRTMFTSITEINLYFKSLCHPHAQTYVYKASGGNLPTSFDSAAPITAMDTVYLYHYGHAVVIIWPGARVIIVISFGSVYQITIRGSQEVMNIGTGMLIDGCPRDQITNTGLILRNSDRDLVAKAEEACLKNGIPAADLEACVFDVVVTEDFEFAGVAAMAREDRGRAVSRDKELSDAGVMSKDWARA